MNIGIIGLGLMGASFGKAFKKIGHTVYGYDTNRETMLKSGLVGAADAPLADATFGKLDVLIIALNPRAFYGAAKNNAPKLRDGAIVLDIGGNKRAVVADMLKLHAEFPGLNFIATHPMAGREFVGINHSTPAIFENASALMIPVNASIQSAALVKKLFSDIGFFRVLPSDPETHDRIIAYTSQLCHILSSAYVASPTAEYHDGYSAGSFRDLTRVAKMNPKMWTELTVDNRGSLIVELDRLIGRLGEFRSALTSGDEAALEALFTEGNERKAVIEKNTREWKKN